MLGEKIIEELRYVCLNHDLETREAVRSAYVAAATIGDLHLRARDPRASEVLGRLFKNLKAGIDAATDETQLLQSAAMGAIIELRLLEFRGLV